MNLKIENQYFGPVISYSALIKASCVDFCRYEPYQKTSFRNRCTLPGANGPINLSVPIEGGRAQKLPFSEVRIDNKDDWQKNHWRTIFSVFGKSPFFNFFSHELEALFQTKKTFLFDWNVSCFEWAQKKLGFKVEIVETEKFSGIENSLLDLTDRILPSTLEEFHKGSVAYTQVFDHKNGFVPNMSILDLICCEGKNAREVLAKTMLPAT